MPIFCCGSPGIRSSAAECPPVWRMNRPTCAIRQCLVCPSTCAPASPFRHPADPRFSLPQAASHRALPACAFSSDCDQRHGFLSPDWAKLLVSIVKDVRLLLTALSELGALKIQDDLPESLYLLILLPALFAKRIHGVLHHGQLLLDCKEYFRLLHAAFTIPSCLTDSTCRGANFFCFSSLFSENHCRFQQTVSGFPGTNAFLWVMDNPSMSQRNSCSVSFFRSFSLRGH